ncbi:PEP/pyruvate-binding domain-containing protein [Kribbella sp. NPDC050124]|uniref:PEP/pyruvate-binding domain-containing protein n=1 Tax=Kribbella sp. NPDC050124 TaxID=3364114 RepID=UPI003794BF70
MNGKWVLRPQDRGGTDAAQVGEKSASLAELARGGIRVPAGFVVTADAYREFAQQAGLGPVIAGELRRYRAGRDVVAVAAAIRTAFCEAALPPALAAEILGAYQELGGDGTEVAVRCSPVAAQDDVRDEVFLHLRSGADILAACRRCFASLFSSVAVGNRELRGPDHLAAVMPVAVQRMVRSDLGASGTARGENTFVRVRAGWGLGEPPAGDPDLYSVHPGARPMIVRHRGAKRTKTVYADPHGTHTIPTTPEERSQLVLTDDELQELARWSVEVDKHFKRPMELEWAKEGRSGNLYLIEVRHRAMRRVTIAEPTPAVRIPRRLRG